jgi:methionine synthase II (cobalamin-independent)
VESFNFAATGIGSVPFLDVEGTCRRILDRCSEIPFWPQFVRRSPHEDMTVQYSEGLPFLELKKDQRTLVVSSNDMESDLIAFYDLFLTENPAHFAISQAYAPGLYEMIAAIQDNPEAHGAYVKGQTVGPVTFAAGVSNHDGKSLLHHPDLVEALAQALAIRALWQVTELSKSGKRVILFLDEPYLSGYGSAFVPIQRDEVIGLIRDVVNYVREKSDALIGIHCCGNTDWPMIIETGPDILSFDASSYMDYFLLYPVEITGFLEQGGKIAWGIVPTFTFTGKETVESVCSHLQKGLDRVVSWGVSPERLGRQSLLTPACGMGTMNEGAAEKALLLLSQLPERCRALFSRFPPPASPERADSRWRAG